MMIHLHLKVASETPEALTALSNTISESTLPSSANLHLHFPANCEMNITFDNPTNKAPSIVPAATAQDQTTEEKGADQSEKELKEQENASPAAVLRDCSTPSESVHDNNDLPATTASERGEPNEGEEKSEDAEDGDGTADTKNKDEEKGGLSLRPRPPTKSKLGTSASASMSKGKRKRKEPNDGEEKVEDAEDRDGDMKKKEGEEGGLPPKESKLGTSARTSSSLSADLVERIASFSTALRGATLSTMQLLAEMYVQKMSNLLYKLDSDRFTCTVTGCGKIYGSPDAAILHVQMAHAPILAEVVEKEFHAAVQRVCTEPPYTSN